MQTPDMNRESVTFRLDAEKRAELDAVARAMDRDRSYVLNEAVEAYLDVHRWQAVHIREGLARPTPVSSRRMRRLRPRSTAGSREAPLHPPGPRRS